MEGPPHHTEGAGSPVNHIDFTEPFSPPLRKLLLKAAADCKEKVFDGAVYASNIVLKNNLHVVYDSRVDQIVGFGPVTLQTESWVETTN